ncbi:MAG: Ig-like domain-containing protein [Kofleriaceae bacterium]
MPIDDSGTGDVRRSERAARGTYPGQAQGCTCTPGTTNSAARLTTFVGLRPPDTEPPTLTVDAPDDGGTVPTTFVVVADATDNDQIAEVEVRLDGAVVGSDASPAGTQYVITVTAAVGGHALTVIARDRDGNEVSRELDVTVGAGCDGCGAGYECVEGTCLQVAGQGCADAALCAGGTCVADGTVGDYCSQACTLGGEACPQGFDCVFDGTFDLCRLNGEPLEGEGGCCQAGGDGRGPMLLGLVVGLGVLGRRRRR